MTLKLSEAIREGAKLRPQGFGTYQSEVNGEVCSCALGAAFEAVYGMMVWKAFDIAWEAGNPLDIRSELERKFPDLRSDVWQNITQRNDHEHQTREQIADWLEGQGL